MNKEWSIKEVASNVKDQDRPFCQCLYDFEHKINPPQICWMACHDLSIILEAREKLNKK